MQCIYTPHAPEFSNDRGLIYKLFGPSVFCFSASGKCFLYL